MDGTVQNVLVALIPLGVIALIAIALSVVRRPSGDAAAREGIVRLALIVIALQCAHFAEEYLTGLHDRLPDLAGLEPVPESFFVVFNAAWIGVWVISAVGVSAGLRVAYFPLWFLAIGMTANLVIHPLLALRVGGYFPGLVTSVIVGIPGVLLLGRLVKGTGGRSAAESR